MILDVLEDIVKARKAKGLDKWKKLEYLQDDLKGKTVSHITFTTCYPGQEGSKKHLGSSSGNLHFLLGYINPGFYVAPYHWKLVDPNLTDEEISSKKHPANPRYWKEAGLEIEDEGDFDRGKPHPSSKNRTSVARASKRKESAFTVKSGYGQYVVVPGERVVYSLNNGHSYRWDVIKESYFAATQPKLDMDEEEEVVEKTVERSPFSPFIYPLVQRCFPKPGSVFPAGPVDVLVKSDRLEFKDGEGNPACLEIFDRVYDTFDLTKGGDIHPSILLQFAVKYLGVDKQELLQYIHRDQDG